MLDIIVGSRARTEILRLLFTPERPMLRLRELAALSGLSVPTLSCDLRKFAAGELVIRERRGREIFCFANDMHPFFQPLCDLVRMTYGTISALLSALSGDDILDVYLAGDCLNRPTAPLEILILSERPYRKINRRLIPVGNGLGRDIRIQVMTPRNFSAMHNHSQWHALKKFEAKKSMN